MRQVQPQQCKLGETGIANLVLDPKSRDDIPPLLRGLQYIYVTPDVREEVFQILEDIVPEDIDPDNGRPGMDLWKILVLGTLRLNLNCDYDRLHELANNHRTVRQMLGHGLIDEYEPYALETLKANVRLLTPEVLDRINQVVVKAGHALVKKSPDEALRGRCDSYVVETDVDYPTDIKLLHDATRTFVVRTARLAERFGLTEWRQSAYQLRQIKRLHRKAQNSKRSKAKDPAKREAQKARIDEAYEAYLERAQALLDKAEGTLITLDAVLPPSDPQLIEIKGYMAHAERQIDQVRRRVIDGETIPHEEKFFSVFEEHTEWISKGKAGVPVELGLRVCVLEDQHGFILHHRVMQQETDDKVAVPMVEETRARFPDLSVCSFDKGFHSPDNQRELRSHLDLVVLPKKGRLSAQDKEHEYSDDFVQARRKHSAVESAINALEAHGLDRCPDHGIDGFERYVALGVVARNIQKLGTILRQKEAPPKQDGRSPPRAA
jgi:IS5 family transposase